ncbi:site-specific integrase [Glaciimonas soli]|uniref:Phage integrase family protein n=1 Tax=Glaciimonas soli TaxID=2590999 RepID=A0A843YX30_9BURK|nr:site-specific integrase [Glaciimonas soli]MQR01116.1 hypothetical protein [Glaciimonas soli]
MTPNAGIRQNDQRKISCADIREELFHADLTLSNDWVLGLKRLEARPDENQYWRFDFKNARLPANSLFPYVQRFSDRTELIKTVCLVMQRYLLRSTNSKERTNRAKTTLHNTLMVIEFLWMQNALSLSSVVPENFNSLPEKLAKNGWYSALEILERAKNIQPAKMKKLIKARTATENFEGGGAKQFDLQEALGTNCNNVLSFLRKNENKASHKTSKIFSSLPDGHASARTITDKLTIINLLYDIGPENGLSFPPFEKPEATGNKFGRPKSRTANIPVDIAAKIISTAYLWVSEYGSIVAELLEEVSEEVIAGRTLTRKWLGRRLKVFFDRSSKRKEACAVLPFPIELLDFGRLDTKGKNSLREAVLCTMTSCFVVIATMNARRKDEILHRKFGLRVGDLRMLSEDHSLFEVDFYIEKTYRRRVPFYVNQLTADAIKLLERIERAFHRIDISVPADDIVRTGIADRSLFSYRRFSLMKGVGKTRKWYDFQAYAHESDASKFLELALAGSKKIGISAHMFRRMYALVFYYQYENADLLALMYQLGHRNLESTLIYVTDPDSRPELEKISAVMDISTTEMQRARRQHLAIVEEELAEVGFEKHAEDVFNILSGKIYAGGYAKYVRRISTRFSQSVRIDVRSEDAILAAVKQRGHFPRPMQHGQCMAGRTLAIQSARCITKEKDRLQRELAGVEMCSNCIFHLTSPAYLKSMDLDLERQKEEVDLITPDSLIFEQRKREVENLERAINLLKIRFVNTPPLLTRWAMRMAMKKSNKKPSVAYRNQAAAEENILRKSKILDDALIGARESIATYPLSTTLVRHDGMPISYPKTLRQFNLWDEVKGPFFQGLDAMRVVRNSNETLRRYPLHKKHIEIILFSLNELSADRSTVSRRNPFRVLKNKLEESERLRQLLELEPLELNRDFRQLDVQKCSLQQELLQLRQSFQSEILKARAAGPRTSSRRSATISKLQK